jgi:hypothetical protein
MTKSSLAMKSASRPCFPRVPRSQAVDQVDDVEEAAAGAVADQSTGNGDGQVGLARAGAADQNDIALLGEEGSVASWRTSPR